MADDVIVELGWGRLIFGQTFADPDELAEVLRHEGRGRRDICMYAREPQVLVALAPAELFIDPSHTYRLRFSDDEPDLPQTGFTVRTLQSADDADAMNRLYVRCGMVSAPVDVIWDNHLHRDPVDYLVAVRDDDGTVVGTVTGRRPQAVVHRPGGRLEPVDPGRRSDGQPARRRRCVDTCARRDLPGPRTCLHGLVRGTRQRPLRSRCTRSWDSRACR